MTALDQAAEHLCRNWKRIMGPDHVPTEGGCPMHRTIAETVIEGLPSEWGVRFPSGAVQELPEGEARKASLAYNDLRPDLPTMVVRKSAAEWGAVIEEPAS